MSEKFHFASDVPLSGTYDEWPRRPGYAGREHVLRSRTKVWAVFVFAKQRQVKNEHFARHGTTRGALPRSVEIDDPGQLGSTLRSPRRRRIKAVEQDAIGSAAVFDHPLWEILDPQSDLRACYDRHKYLVRTTDEGLRDGPLVSMLKPGAEPNLDAIAILCARLRLAKHLRDDIAAFQAGCDITRALCFLSLSKEFGGSIQDLTEVVVRTCLAGLSHGSVRFKSNLESYSAFFEVLALMRVKVNSATGRYPFSSAPEHSWSMWVGLYAWLIDLFSTPEGGSQEEVEVAVEAALRTPWSKTLGRALSPFDRTSGRR